MEDSTIPTLNNVFLTGKQLLDTKIVLFCGGLNKDVVNMIIGFVHDYQRLDAEKVIKSYHAQYHRETRRPRERREAQTVFLKNAFNWWFLHHHHDNKQQEESSSLAKQYPDIIVSCLKVLDYEIMPMMEIVLIALKNFLVGMKLHPMNLDIQIWSTKFLRFSVQILHGRLDTDEKAQIGLLLTEAAMNHLRNNEVLSNVVFLLSPSRATCLFCDYYYSHQMNSPDLSLFRIQSTIVKLMEKCDLNFLKMNWEPMVSILLTSIHLAVVQGENGKNYWNQHQRTEQERKAIFIKVVQANKDAFQEAFRKLDLIAEESDAILLINNSPDLRSLRHRVRCALQTEQGEP